ncbi:salivary glue protein Sgs-3-like isoform X1 [Anopheles albimanus]|uniref:salivary glue protein Sgs-3-like isoform X1 n=1 Tax=Anopheles albimanus TaxID=7167 RepID=UPI00163E6CEC|nr:salivary glue protein Sgs-3-like isoform X1 [Anopheles albimanus]
MGGVQRVLLLLFALEFTWSTSSGQLMCFHCDDCDYAMVDIIQCGPGRPLLPFPDSESTTVPTTPTFEPETTTVTHPIVPTVQPDTTTQRPPCSSSTTTHMPPSIPTVEPETTTQAPPSIPTVEPETTTQVPPSIPTVEPETTTQVPPSIPTIEPETTTQVPPSIPTIEPETSTQVPPSIPTIEPETTTQIPPSVPTIEPETTTVEPETTTISTTPGGPILTPPTHPTFNPNPITTTPGGPILTPPTHPTPLAPIGFGIVLPIQPSTPQYACLSVRRVGTYQIDRTQTVNSSDNLSVLLLSTENNRNIVSRGCAPLMHSVHQTCDNATKGGHQSCVACVGSLCNRYN